MIPLFSTVSLLISCFRAAISPTVMARAAMLLFGTGTATGHRAPVLLIASETAWTIGDEANNGLKHEPYMLSMAKTNNAHTGGSQFFIVSPGGQPPSHLDNIHTVFGKVVGGQDVVDKIDAVVTEGAAGSDPVYPVTLVDASFSGDSSSPWWQIW